MYTNNWGPIGSEFVFKSIFFSIHHIRIPWRKEQVSYEMVLTCAYIRNLRELQPARMISIVVWWLLTVTRPWFSSRLRAFNNCSELYLLHKGGVETVDIHRNGVCGVHQYLWKQGDGQIQGYSVQTCAWRSISYLADFIKMFSCRSDETGMGVSWYLGGRSLSA